MTITKDFYAIKTWGKFSSACSLPLFILVHYYTACIDTYFFPKKDAIN